MTDAPATAMPEFDLSDITLELNPSTVSPEPPKAAELAPDFDTASINLDVAVEESPDMSNSAEMATKLAPQPVA